MQRHIWRVVVVIGGIGLVAVLRASAAPQAAAAGADVQAALLTEVRALRLAIEQMATVAPRVQLAMGRLQLQEQRVATLVRRQQELHSSVTGTESSIDEQRRMLVQLEQTTQDASRPAQERTAADEQAKAMRAQMASMETSIQQLRADEASVAQELAGEQARWNDINQRLEELDRALARR
jgi:chromosome segregation ATPase